jgi:23S rRNA pseudouridine1911/1915/1917 synthase
MLSQGRISVNGDPCKIASHPIQAGDRIEIGPRKTPVTLPGGLEILYEDNEILTVQKPPGMLTVATIGERERTVYAYLRRYVKDRNPRQKLFIVHRLDGRERGPGFAKSEKVKSVLQGVFSRHEIQRKYWVIVEGKVEKDRGTIRSRLAEDNSPGCTPPKTKARESRL